MTEGIRKLNYCYSCEILVQFDKSPDIFELRRRTASLALTTHDKFEHGHMAVNLNNKKMFKNSLPPASNLLSYDSDNTMHEDQHVFFIFPIILQNVLLFKEELKFQIIFLKVGLINFFVIIINFENHFIFIGHATFFF